VREQRKGDAHEAVDLVEHEYAVDTLGWVGRVRKAGREMVVFGVFDRDETF
jgi:hypothetical protein